MLVDIDGSGPLLQVPIMCGLDTSGYPITAVLHDTQEKTKVDGFQAKGSFSQSIHYQVKINCYHRKNSKQILRLRMRKCLKS